MRISNQLAGKGTCARYLSGLPRFAGLLFLLGGVLAIVMGMAAGAAKGASVASHSNASRL